MRNTRVRKGQVRRLALGTVVVAVALSGYGLSTAQASSRGAVVAPPAPVPEPTEPASVLTVVIGAEGEIALPHRTTAPCDALSPCPAGLAYTTIAPERIVVQLVNPTGVTARVKLARAFARRIDAEHDRVRVGTRLRVSPRAQYLLTVTTKTSTHQLVVWATSNPYTPAIPTTPPVPTTIPAAHHVVVTFDDNGVHAAPDPSPPGYTGVLFVDQRSNPTGVPFLRVLVHAPNLGDLTPIPVGIEITRLLCPRQWALVVIVPGVGEASGSLLVDGTTPECTTPVT